jgi:hypothetical protein
MDDMINEAGGHDPLVGDDKWTIHIESAQFICQQADGAGLELDASEVGDQAHRPCSIAS